MIRFPKRMLLSFLVLGSPLTGQSVDLRWEVGAIDGEAHEIWGRIEGAAIGHGRIVATDIQATTVRMFDLSGRFMKELGGLGQGPGEFIRPISVEATTSGFLVTDLVNNRLTTFDRNGGLLETRRLDLPPPTPLAKASQWGSAVVATTAVVGIPASDGGADRSKLSHAIIVAQLGGEAIPVDTIAVGHGSVIRFKVGTTPWWNPSHLSIGPHVDHHVSGDTLFLLDGWAGKLHRMTRRDGVPFVTVTHDLPGAGRRLGPDDHRAIEIWLGEGALADPRIREYEIPLLFPAWSAVRSGPDGGAWLRRSSLESLTGSAGESWDLVSGSGIVVRSVTFPIDTRVLAFDGWAAVGVRTDEFGVQYLQLFHVN